MTYIIFRISYGLDINMDRVEDVLVHQKLLALAKDPEKRPVYYVRFMEVRPFALLGIKGLLKFLSM